MTAEAYSQTDGRGSRLLISEDPPEAAQVTGRWIAARFPVEVRA